MPIELKNLPSLIAIPYSETLKKDSIQRKDFQRLVLENALTLNSIIAISDFYNHNRKREDDSDRKLNTLPNVPNIDLGQISVGTWNMFSREFSKVLKTDPKGTFLNNIVDLYHGSAAKEWENLAGSLITIRNKDAHGELIAADKLTAELDKRQEILDKFISMLDFYKDYKLIVPTSTTLENGKVVYNCRDFSGLLDSAISIYNSKDDLDVMRVYLYNTKTSRALCLNPMLIAHPVSKENNEINLFLYSKTTNKKLGNLHYLSLDSSKDFTVDNTENLGDFLTSSEICEEFQSFRIYVEDPSLHDQKKPIIAISRKLSNDFISNNDLLEMQLIIKNEGDSTAENVNIILNYPSNNFIICNKEGEKLNLKKGIEELFDDELSIDSGQSYELKLYFVPKDSGQYEFPEIVVNYEYTDFQGNVVKPKTEKDGTTINIETGASLFCTVYDPADPFSLAPVINISMQVDFGLDEKGNKRIFAYIGETIPLTITITNQGLGVAKDVDFTVFVPEGIIIDQTNTNWKGNINPLQEVSKTFDMKLIIPGIHSISIRDVVFKNQNNILYKTNGGVLNFLVRNNPEIQYRQLMQQVWTDLEIDDDELDEMKYLSKKYGKILEDSVKKAIETDEKMKVIKSIISNISSTKGFKLIEKSVNGNRIIYAYNVIDCPIIMIDYGNSDDIKIYLRADLQGKYPIEIVSVKGYIRNLSMSKIGMNEPIEGSPQDFKGGASALKGLLGRAIGWIEKHDWLQVQLKHNFANGLGISGEQISAKMFGNRMTYSLNKYILLSEFYTYFDNKNNLHLIAKFDRDLSERKKLVELGSKFMKMNAETELNAFDETGGSASSLLYVGNQKVNNDDDRMKFSNKLILFILQILELQNNELENILISKNIEEEQILKIMLVHNSLLSEYAQIKTKENIKALLFKLDFEDKGKNYNLEITYYAIKDLPIYQQKQEVLKIKADKKNINFLPKNFDETIIDRKSNVFVIRKSPEPYLINEILDLGDEFLPFIQSMLVYSGNEKIIPGYHIIKKMMEEEWVTSIHKVIEYLIEHGNQASYDELQSFFDENEIPGKINGIMKQFKVSFARFQFENFLESSSSTQTISILNDFLPQVIKAKDDYSFKLDPYWLAIQQLKELHRNLMKHEFVPDHMKRKSGYLGYGATFGAWIGIDMNKGSIRISIQQLQNTPEVEILTEAINTIPNVNGFEIEYIKDLTKLFNKGVTGAKIFIPYDNIIEIFSNEWLNNFFKTYNQFIQIFLIEENLDKFYLRELNYLEFEDKINSMKLELQDIINSEEN